MTRWGARLPWGAALVFVVAALGWLSADVRVPREAFRDYSIYNQAAGGLSLAYRFLEASGRTVKPLARPVERAFLPSNAVLFRIRPESQVDPVPRGQETAVHLRPIYAWEPSQPSTYPFTAEEEDWLRGGGRLVLALDRPYSSIDVRPAEGLEVQKVFPGWPGVERLEGPAVRTLQGPVSREGHAIFAVGGDPALLRSPRGRGDLILCSFPELFQNGSIGRGDHLALLERLAGAGRPVYFDEFVHGLEGESGLVELLRHWGFGPFLLLSVLAALAVFWRRRARVGPEEDDARETRVEAVELVDSLALLYRRILPRRQALALYIRVFEKSVALQTGLREGALQARVREFLPGRPPRTAGRDLPVQEFQRELELVNIAFRRLNDAKRPGSGRSTAAGARTP